MSRTSQVLLITALAICAVTPPVHAESPQLDNPSFDGISFERILSGAKDRPLFVDLDTGRYMTPPSNLFHAEGGHKLSLANLAFTTDLKAWVRRQGIDAAVQADGSSVTLVGLELQVGDLLVPTTNSFSKLTPEKVAHFVKQAEAGTWITCRYTFSDDKYGSVLPFTTREAGIGSLSIDGFTDLCGPDSVRLCYRIARPDHANGRVQQVPEPPILEDFAGFLVVDLKGGNLQLRLPPGRGTITLKEDAILVSSSAHQDLTAARINTGHLDIDALNKHVLLFGRGRKARVCPAGAKVRIEMEDRVAEDTTITILMPELEIWKSLDWRDK